MVKPENELSPEAFKKLVAILAVAIPKMEQKKKESA